MAKGARSSVRKTNNQKLKKNVFGPVEDARTKRLSEKLLELAQQPRPAKDDMEIEKDREPRAVQSCHRDSHTNPFSEPADDAQPQETEAAEVDVDDESKPSASSGLKKKTGRVQKKRRGKATSTIAFKNFKTGAKKSGFSHKGRR
ncbi:hypothetical protein IWZ01DRAFT_490368 [Phyllosticta capitalensis]